jgi:hypothetical protein
MTTAYSGDGITFPDNSVQATAPRVGMVNRIINGGMVFDQRNGGALIANPNGAYTLDRWLVYESTDGVISVQQVTDAPAGFSNSLKATTTTADASIGATQYAYLEHRVEGYNFADFAFGTANAQSTTLSFQIKSSLTGTFGGVLMNNANDRCYPFTYTINSANTWEQKSITVAGDISGDWLTTNGRGIRVIFGWGIGSTYSGTAGAWASSELYSPTGAVSLAGTLNATWQITGVQLEKGSTATDFEYVDYGSQLQMCQRYYCLSRTSNTSIGGGGMTGRMIIVTNGSGLTSGRDGLTFIPYPVTTRAAPTVTTYSYNGTSGATSNITGGSTDTNTSVVGASGCNGFSLSSGSYRTFYCWFDWTASAEL